MSIKLKLFKMMLVTTLISVQATELIFAQAKSSTVQARKSFTYEISGIINGLKNDTLFLFINSPAGASAKGIAKTDTIVIPAKDDRIDVKGSYPRLAFVKAQIGSKRRGGTSTFIIEEGKLKIEGVASSPDQIKVNGGPQNDAYNFAMDKQATYYNRMPALQQALSKLDESQPEYKNIEAKIEAIQDSFSNFSHQYAKQHASMMVSGNFTLMLQHKLSVEELESLYMSLHDDVKSYATSYGLADIIATRKNTAIGKIAPSFTMIDTEGRPVSFSSYKGKYVLLDFWASWCVPCRKDNPFLVKAYEKYKGKSFTIVSISLDKKAEMWKEAIQKDGLTWVHLSDLSGIQNPVAKLYGVLPIPDNFLIDPAGIIIARGLRGEDLEKKLNEIIR